MSHICANCIGNPVLSSIVAAAATQDYICDYCERGRPAADLHLVARQCDKVIETFFEVSSRTMAVIHFNRTPAGEDIETLLTRLVQAPQEAIEELIETLNTMWYDVDTDESIYGEDPWFTPANGSASATTLHSAWTEMEASLRGEARYLNPKVMAFMNSIFGQLESEVTEDGASVLTSTTLHPSYNTFYRARVFSTPHELELALQHPERSLGAPPTGIGKGGRMNAPGQTAFYGATSEKVALAEVRPPVGSLVAVARFAVSRPLTLLNLGLLERVHLHPSANYFDENSKEAFRRHAFLRDLSRVMVRPVMPESQDHNYLITQVVADYLAMHPSISIDGIIYPSVQRGTGFENTTGENVVLFYKAAVALFGDDGKDTAEAALYDYEQDEYERGHTEEPPLQPTISYNEQPSEPTYSWRYETSRPTPGLTLIRDSIVVHRILAVDIKTDPICVEVVKRRT